MAGAGRGCRRGGQSQPAARANMMGQMAAAGSLEGKGWFVGKAPRQKVEQVRTLTMRLRLALPARCGGALAARARARALAGPGHAALARVLRLLLTSGQRAACSWRGLVLTHGQPQRAPSTRLERSNDPPPPPPPPPVAARLIQAMLKANPGCFVVRESENRAGAYVYTTPAHTPKRRRHARALPFSGLLLLVGRGASAATAPCSRLACAPTPTSA